jgi:nitrogen regulatory protein PII
MSEFQPKPVKMMCVIINRNLDKKVTQLLNENDIEYHLAIPGRGTASTDMQTYLGIGEAEKSVILVIVEEERVNEIFARFQSELNFSAPNTGIAFTIKISSLSNMLALQYITGFLENKEN